MNPFTEEPVLEENKERILLQRNVLLDYYSVFLSIGVLSDKKTIKIRGRVAGADYMAHTYTHQYALTEETNSVLMASKVDSQQYLIGHPKEKNQLGGLGIMMLLYYDIMSNDYRILSIDPPSDPVLKDYVLASMEHTLLQDCFIVTYRHQETGEERAYTVIPRRRKAVLLEKPAKITPIDPLTHFFQPIPEPS